MATNRKRRLPLLREVQKQVKQRLAGPVNDLKAGHVSLAYFSLIAQHCAEYAALPCFLEAARSDVVAILYAGTLGMERTAYLHARSLLENLVRHFFYDSRPALFVARQLEDEDSVRDNWTELTTEIRRLPSLRSALVVSVDPDEAVSTTAKPTEDSSLFAELQDVYKTSSRFIHGSTLRYRSMYDGIRSVAMDAERTEALNSFLKRLCECCLPLLALYHLGPYLLISQPIRRYALEDMGASARRRFLHSLDDVSLTWATHQRDAALRSLRERKRRPTGTCEGLLLEKNGVVRVADPRG